jgi:hypothetical protein
MSVPPASAGRVWLVIRPAQLKQAVLTEDAGRSSRIQLKPLIETDTLGQTKNTIHEETRRKLQPVSVIRVLSCDFVDHFIVLCHRRMVRFSTGA